MRWWTLASHVASVYAIEVAAITYAPFVNPYFGIPDSQDLVRRQACQNNGVQCTNVGVEEACCPTNYICGADEEGHVACCTENFACTGTVDISLLANPTAAGSTTRTTSPTSVTTTGSQTGTTTVTGGGAPVTGSTIPNNYYPFVYMATSFTNTDDCSTAVSECQAQSTSCFNSIAGGNGVTVSGINGGITTQEGSAGTIVAASASSICGSLSLRACYALQPDQCASLTGGAVIQAANNGPRQTAGPGMLYAAGVGAIGAFWV